MLIKHRDVIVDGIVFFLEKCFQHFQSAPHLADAWGTNDQIWAAAVIGAGALLGKEKLIHFNSLHWQCQQKGGAIRLSILAQNHDVAKLLHHLDVDVHLSSRSKVQVVFNAEPLVFIRMSSSKHHLPNSSQWQTSSSKLQVLNHPNPQPKLEHVPLEDVAAKMRVEKTMGFRFFFHGFVIGLFWFWYSVVTDYITYITHQKAIYKWYISGIYCQLGDYMPPTTLQTCHP